MGNTIPIEESELPIGIFHKGYRDIDTYRA